MSIFTPKALQKLKMSRRNKPKRRESTDYNPDIRRGQHGHMPEGKNKAAMMRKIDLRYVDFATIIHSVQSTEGGSRGKAGKAGKPPELVLHRKNGTNAYLRFPPRGDSPHGYSHGSSHGSSKAAKGGEQGGGQEGGQGGGDGGDGGGAEPTLEEWYDAIINAIAVAKIEEEEFAAAAAIEAKTFAESDRRG
jgi:hypothetical protein